MIVAWLVVLSVLFVLVAFRTQSSIEKLRQMLVVTSRTGDVSDEAAKTKEALLDAIDELSEKVVVNGATLDNIVFMQGQMKDAIRKSTTESRGAIEGLDSTLAGMHNTVNKSTEEIKKCMTGIDENTRKIYGDLITAVEKNDIAKLADVVRAAKAFVENYDAVKDAAMMPFAATDFSSHKSNFEKCLEAGKFIGVQKEGTFAEERKALEKLYKSFER